MAYQRSLQFKGKLILRNEDLDRARCQPAFVEALAQDLRWFGFEWHEGPDLGGPFGPYHQSERMATYRAAFERLRIGGFVYPCFCSRRDIRQALTAPHAADEEPVYPGTCRPQTATPETGTSATPEILGNRSHVILPSAVPGQTALPGIGGCTPQPANQPHAKPPLNWRFRIPDGETITFIDGHFGTRQFTAGIDFGDFVVWRHDDLPAYQLAVTVDDHTMRITEVVRGADLLVSTARQLLLYRALDWAPPAFFHCPLLTDDQGNRLAKRHDALSLRSLRDRGEHPEKLRAAWPLISP